MSPLTSARQELQSLLRQKAVIERKIEAVQKTIKLLEPAYEQQPDDLLLAELEEIIIDSAGLTDRVKEVLRAAAPDSFSPAEMRDQILKSGFDATGRSNFLSEIHNTLKRLTARGIAQEVPRAFAGTKGYRWAMSSPRGRLTPPESVTKAATLMQQARERERPKR